MRVHETSLNDENCRTVNVFLNWKMNNLTTTYRFSFMSDQRRTKTFFALLVMLLCMTQHVVANGIPQDDKTLEKLEKMILPQINEDSMKLVAVVIRSTTSPDDSLQLNKNANDADYAFFEDLCDNYLAKNDEQQLKSTLIKTGKDQLWQRLLSTYYPGLRSARIMLYFRKQESSETVVVIKEITLDEAPKTDATDIKPTLAENDDIDTDDIDTDDITADIISADTLLPSEVDSIGVFIRKKKLAVKTNMLLYGAYVPGYNRWAPIPNVAIELYPMKGHFTFGASFDMPWWQDYNAHKYFQFRNYQLETRYYPRGAVRADKSGDHVYEENIEAYEHNKKAFTGFYLQAYTHLAVFGICFDANRGWVGEGIGAGVGMGYVLPLSHNGRWKLELGLQAGFFRCKYDPYQYENPVNPAYRDGLYYYKWTKKPSLFKKRQYRWNWIGPTRIGITISYDLLYRRIQKKGVSLKAYETYRTFKAKEADEPNEAERRVKP